MTAGEDIFDILETEGIDVSALGKPRIYGMREKLQKYANRADGFEKRVRCDRLSVASQSATGSRQRHTKPAERLEHELAYADKRLNL